MATLPAGPFIYALTSGDAVTQARALLAGGVRVIQLRDKRATPEEQVAPAREIAALCEAAGAAFFVNDHLELALGVPGAGLHVGQGDLPVSEARRRLGPDRLLGVSTHTAEQFEEALAGEVDYVAVGPVFPTSTKANADPVVGIEFVRKCWLRVSQTPKRLVAIGGIRIEDLPDLRGAAPDLGIAMINALVGKPDVERAAREAIATLLR